MAEPKFNPETKDLASRIYTELASHNVLITDKGVQMPVGADNLAKLSFKLAEAFQRVYEDLNAENMPKDPTYKLGSEDMASWVTK